jgi:hypothetical protein
MHASNALLDHERATMPLNFQGLGQNHVERDSLHYMMSVGKAVMEKEEITSLFYSLTTSFTTDDPVWRLNVGLLVDVIGSKLGPQWLRRLHLLNEDYRTCGQRR